MSSSWPTVKLKKVLTLSKEVAEIDANDEYKEITVRLWGKGVKLRNLKKGREFSSTKRFIAYEDQFIISKIDARHGAYGVIPESLNGGVVSNDFPLFEANPNKLNVNYLNWLSKSPWFIEACKNASKGTTNRKRLKENLFLNIEVPLPSIQIQNEITKKLNEFQAKINEGIDLRESLIREAEALLSSAFHELIKDAVYEKMHKVAPIVRRKIEILIDGEYPELGARSFGKGIFHKPTLFGAELDWQKLFEIRSGDLVISNIKAWEGAIAAAENQDSGRVASHRYITCVPKDGVTNAQFLSFYLLSQEGIEKVRKASPGSADRNRTLGMRRLEKIEVPIPEYQKQLWFNKLQQNVLKIKNAQKKNEIELQALMPSILDKAFKGELI